MSTPIGNLADTTYRAVEVLGRVSRVLAEDTRRTSVLLRHFEIATPLVSLHEHNEAAREAQILGWLDAGEDLAMVSDAGTPLLSDPGARIVRSVVESGHAVVPVPGASAILAALVASGLDPEPFTFEGFLPRKGRERSDRLDGIAMRPHTSVVFEAPNRLQRLLRDLQDACGGDREAVVARELTKVHETFRRGTVAELVDYYQGGAVRGEVVVLVAGRSEPPPDADAAGEEAARALVRALLDEGRRPSRVAREVAQRLGLPRNQVYELTLSESKKEGEDAT